MNEALGLRILANLLDWTNEQASAEYRWLRFMSRYKYDGYHGFVAGMRFVASLISWLKQFRDIRERRTAYEFVRKRLVYLGPAELTHLVRLVYPEVIRPRLARAIATQYSIPEYLVWAHPDSEAAYRRLLRASLFFALSDGARIDVFRRANAGLINNEQVLVAPQIHDSKWKSVLKKLQKEQGDDARFEFVFLLDDFTASGATFVRYDDEDKEWTGKLVRFWEDISPVRESHFRPGWILGVHHYIASHAASQWIRACEETVRGLRPADKWFPSVEFTYGTILPSTVRLDDSRDGPFLSIAEAYYDPAIETKHSEVGGTSLVRGFGDCALPLVLEHNTPNNSMALLWAESVGVRGAHPMRPLFRRRQRHV